LIIVVLGLIDAGLGILPPTSIIATMPTFSLADGLPPISVPSVVSVASSLANLTSPAAPVTPAAATVPASSSPLPAKLVKRILDREYIDMAELVPDSWRFQEEEQSKCCYQNICLPCGSAVIILPTKDIGTDDLLEDDREGSQVFCWRGMGDI